MSDIQFKFTYYEPWMKEQIVDLFCKEYDLDSNAFSMYFDKYYFNENHQPKNIKTVVLDGEIVAGFVSYISWPFVVDGKPKNAVQASNGILNANYRGKGMFNKLYDFFDTIVKENKIDFVVGFPIKPTLGLYAKNKWQNLFNLQWFVKPVNPFAGLIKFNEISFEKRFTKERIALNGAVDLNKNCAKESADFLKWRDEYRQFMPLNKVYFLNFELGEKQLQFELKINERGRIIELIIGNIRTNAWDKIFISKALFQLQKKAFFSRQVTLLSIAINESSSNKTLLRALKKSWFFKIKKDICFVVKSFEEESLIENAGDWNLFRADLDTW